VSFLLDTVVVSELRKRDCNPTVAHWVRSQQASELFLSVVTIGEIEKGISRQRRVNPEFADTLAQWLETTLQHYGDQIIPITTAIARRWGRLSDEIGHSGADLLIAATAIENGLVVVTRNTRHFRPTGVKVVDPFSDH